MVDWADSREIAMRVEELYEVRWRAELERDHLHVFAAMEPESATYFLGKSFGDAIRSARRVPPDRVTFTLRIGQGCADEMVGMQIEQAVSARMRANGKSGGGNSHGDAGRRLRGGCDRAGPSSFSIWRATVTELRRGRVRK